MENYCSTCVHLTSDKDWWGDYYCNYRQKYISSNNKACENYTKKPDQGYRRAGCFITTIVCKLLGMPDDCEVLTALRDFRENYLKNTEEGKNLLIVYDVKGPIISDCLNNEEPDLAKKIANEIFEIYLEPCVSAFKEKEYSKAIKTYIKLFIRLEYRYKEYLEDLEIDYSKPRDINTLGKGRIKPSRI